MDGETASFLWVHAEAKKLTAQAKRRIIKMLHVQHHCKEVEIRMINRFERFSLAIAASYRYWHKIAAEELEVYGLKGPHATYLTTMSQYSEGLTGPQLCELCDKDKSDVSRTMSLMIKKGLAVKEGPHQNRYGGIYKLTENGRAAAEAISRRASLAVEMVGEGATDEQREVFYEVLESISENLKRISKEGLPND